MIVWNERSVRWFRNASEYTGYNKKLAQILLEYIPSRKSLCDMGCGAALIDFELAKHIENITCVDISQEAIHAVEQQAKVLVMDEPSASLDFGNRIRVMQTVRSLVADGYAVVQTTHDPEQAFMYSDKILAIHDGRVLAWGTPQAVLEDALMSKLYGIDVEVHSLHNDAIRVCVPANSL